jgi:hypothetical protein
MNEREEFLQYFQSVFPRMAERIQTMTESQVLDGLSEVKAARDIYVAELAERFKTMTESQSPGGPHEVKAARDFFQREQAFRKSIGKMKSWMAFFNSVEGLRSQQGAGAHAGGSPPALFDTIEEALNQRLETLRRKGT